MLRLIRNSPAVPEQVLLKEPGLPEIAKIKQIQCGTMHSLVFTESGFLFGFGDNSRGQINPSDNQSALADCVYRKPKRIGCVDHLICPDTKCDGHTVPSLTIFADDRLSAMSIGEKKRAHRLFGWGTSNMIDSVSRSAQVLGREHQHSISAGAYARGGSGSQHGVFAIEHSKDGQRPFCLFVGH